MNRKFGARRMMARPEDAMPMRRGMRQDMGGGMRMQPPTPVNRPVPDELVYKKGGSVKESKAMMKKEVSFMKKKGAPKSMLKHEMKEAGMKKGAKRMMGGGMPGYKKGGMTKSGSSASKRADGIAIRGKTKGKMLRMGGEC